MRSARKWIAAVLYIILSMLALPLGFFLFFGSLFGNQYSEPIGFGNVVIMFLVLVGTALGVAGGIKGLTKKPAGKGLFITIAALVTIGSIPYFLRDLGEFGIIAFLIGILPTLIYIIVRGGREVEVKDIINGER